MTGGGVIPNVTWRHSLRVLDLFSGFSFVSDFLTVLPRLPSGRFSWQFSWQLSKSVVVSESVGVSLLDLALRYPLLCRTWFHQEIQDLC